MQLTAEQIAYLRQHSIPLGSVFDASGLRGAALKKAMEEHEKLFAYNASPCSRGGHTLRSRSGHCIQCSPAAIGFLKRSFAEQFVYIAASTRGRFIKIGTTDDVERRKWQLNNWQYGRQFDWQMLAFAHTCNAGRVEGEAHGRLARYSTEGDYTRDGRRQQCLELFRCNFEDAEQALGQALGGTKLQVQDRERARQAFNFR